MLLLNRFVSMLAPTLRLPPAWSSLANSACKQNGNETFVLTQQSTYFNGKQAEQNVSRHFLYYSLQGMLCASPSLPFLQADMARAVQQGMGSCSVLLFLPVSACLRGRLVAAAGASPSCGGAWSGWCCSQGSRGPAAAQRTHPAACRDKGNTG
jgi:hypothetical protein